MGASTLPSTRPWSCWSIRKIAALCRLHIDGSIGKNLNAADITYIGLAVRHNTRIEELEITWDLPRENISILPREDVPRKYWNDLLYFIENNPSLQIISMDFEGAAFADDQIWIMQAAAQNKNIKCVKMDPLLASLLVPRGAKMLYLFDFDVRAALSWSVNHSLQKLLLSSNPEQMLLAASSILEQEADPQNISSIQCLEMRGHWTPALPNFLSSKASSLGSLRLSGCIMHSREMHELIRGLQSSPTTAFLSMHHCSFDVHSTRQFIGFLGHPSSPITQLHMCDVLGFNGLALAQLLTCEQLQALEILGMAEGIHPYRNYFKDKLERCQLTKLTLNQCQLQEFLPSMENLAFGPLRCLGITLRIDHDSWDSFVQNIRSIASLIQNTRCQIQSLELCGNQERNINPTQLQELSSAMLELFRENTRLEGLIMSKDLWWGSDDYLYPFIGEVQNLRNLKLNHQPNRLKPINETRLEEALSRNWQMESLLNYTYVAGRGTWMQYEAHGHPHPVIFPALQATIDGFMQRNKMRKRIVALPVNASHEELFEILEALWVLPDWASLALWLMEKAPQLFAVVAA